MKPFATCSIVARHRLVRYPEMCFSSIILDTRFQMANHCAGIAYCTGELSKVNISPIAARLPDRPSFLSISTKSTHIRDQRKVPRLPTYIFYQESGYKADAANRAANVQMAPRLAQTFTSLPTNMQYVVLHVTFSQSITKITETEKIQKLKLNRTGMNFVKTVWKLKLI